MANSPFSLRLCTTSLPSKTPRTDQNRVYYGESDDPAKTTCSRIDFVSRPCSFCSQRRRASNGRQKMASDWLADAWQRVGDMLQHQMHGRCAAAELLLTFRHVSIIENMLPMGCISTAGARTQHAPPSMPTQQRRGATDFVAMLQVVRTDQLLNVHDTRAEWLVGARGSHGRSQQTISISSLEAPSSSFSVTEGSPAGEDLSDEGVWSGWLCSGGTLQPAMILNNTQRLFCVRVHGAPPQDDSRAFGLGYYSGRLNSHHPIYVHSNFL